MIKLSILIPSLDSRRELLDKLLVCLSSQIINHEEVEILTSIDNGENSIGSKRNELLELAKGKYLCFFDDDDVPSKDYISKTLKAIKEDKDCCSFTGVITIDNGDPELFEHSLKYKEWKTNSSGYIKYERYPNHLNAIRSSIAKQFRFKEVSHGEDHDWSTQIHLSGLIKSEATIEGVIYHYQYVTNK